MTQARRTRPGPRRRHDPHDDYDSFDRRHRAALEVTAAAVTLDRQAAADAVQDALLAAYRDWPRVSTLDRPDLWVRRVVLNRAIDHGRRRRRWGALGSVDRGLVSQLGDTVAFWEAVHRLSPRQQQVVVLRAVDELSVQEIATTLDLAEGTVKATLHQARARLRELLAIDDPNPTTTQEASDGPA